jgi:hypothetical protein
MDKNLSEDLEIPHMMYHTNSVDVCITDPENCLGNRPIWGSGY